MKNLVYPFAVLAAALAPAGSLADLSSTAYVQDGLISQWDALENTGRGSYSASATVWKDLVGKYDMTVNTSCGSFTENALKKTANGVLARTSGKPSNVRAIEAAVTGSGSGKWVMPIFVSKYQYLCWSSGTEARTFYFDDSNFGLKGVAYVSPMTVSVRYPDAKNANACFLNGKLASGTPAADWWTDVSNMSMGGRDGFSGNDTSTYNYSIHGVRLYSRTLRDFEIAHNAAIDGVRYYGKAIPTGSRIVGDSLEYALTFKTGAHGTLSIDDGEPIESTNAYVKAMTTFRLKATPQSGWVFKSWSGSTALITSGALNDPEITVQVGAACELTATYTRMGLLSAANYIMDGLILQLDGIDNAGVGDHVEGTNVWKDLVGNCGDFNINTACAAFTDGDGLTKNATGYMAQNKKRSSDIRTIDMALSNIPATGWVMAFTAGGSQYLTLTDNNSGYRTYCLDYKMTKGPTIADKSNPYTVAVTYTKPSTTLKCETVYHNGVAMVNTEAVDFDNWGDSKQNDMSLGGRAANGYSELNVKGYTIHAVRLYNRILTAEEAYRNALLDGIRYRNQAYPDGYRRTNINLECRVRTEAGPHGTVSAPGLAAATSVDAWTTRDVTLTAIPDAGSAFVRWTGDIGKIVSGSATTPTITVRVIAPATLKAVFSSEMAWTANGSDSKISTAENWNVAEPDLTNGGTMATFGAGNTATLPASGSPYALDGLKISNPNFTFAAEDGAKFMLGSRGLTNLVAGTVWNWPTEIAYDQVWYAKANSTLELRAPLSGAATVRMRGPGRTDVYATNTFSGTLLIGQDNIDDDIARSEVYLHPGAVLAAPNAIVKVGVRNIPNGLHLMGNTIDHALTVGTFGSDIRHGIYSDVGVTNIINGAFATQYQNASYFALKGVTILRGGADFQTSSKNKWQRFNPFDGAKSVLRIERKPVKSKVLELKQGTLELATANNLFISLGLRMASTGLLKTEVAYAVKAQNKTAIDEANSIGMTGGTWDLCGCDQSVDYFCAQGGTITSKTPAQLHDVMNAYQPNRENQSDVYANFGTTGSVCKAVFTGGAGLAKEGSLNLYLASQNASTGTLSVAKGSLIVSAAGGKYPNTGLTKTTGSWTAGRVSVSGGTLVVEHGKAFGKEVALAVTGGQIELPAGVRAKVASLTVNGTKLTEGVYGSSTSGAPLVPTTSGGTEVFTGNGILRVGRLGTTILLR